MRRIEKMLRVGDKIKVVDEWIGFDHGDDDDIDSYLGEWLTIYYIEVDCEYVLINEDRGNWQWYPEMINWEETMANVTPIRRIEVKYQGGII
jgi:hypothetical protein